MNLYKVIVVLILFYSTAAYSFAGDEECQLSSGFGFEIILTKLELLYDKVDAMESRIQKDREIAEKNLNGFVSQMERTIDKKLNGAIRVLSQKIDQKLHAAISALSHNISALHAKSNAVMEERLQSQTNFVIKTVQGITERHSYEAIAACDKIRQTIVEKSAAMQLEENERLYKYILWANHEQMRNQIEMVHSKEDFARLKRQTGNHLWHIALRSCKESPSQKSGKYILQDTIAAEVFLGYCVQTFSTGTWLQIQYRFDGLVDFYRNWTEYRKGFGDYGGEHWIGLELLHRLTSARPHELHVYLKDFGGKSKYAGYREFVIGSVEEQYALKKLGSYSGTAGDSLSSHVGMKFSTKDRDNDLVAGNCASSYKGGWWYNRCYESNLNGIYMMGEDSMSMNWYHFNLSRMGLAVSRMYIREL